MNTREYYAECFKAEKPKFLSVFRAIPPDQGSYRPHPKCNSAADLVWMLAKELGEACEVVDRGELHFVPSPAPAKIADSIAAYEKNAAELEKRIARLDDAAWGKKARMLAGGKVIWETTVGDMLFGFLFDAVHHRGQLTAYLRPMGGKVPSVYGPSGDDPGM